MDTVYCTMQLFNPCGLEKLAEQTIYILQDRIRTKYCILCSKWQIYFSVLFVVMGLFIGVFLLELSRTFSIYVNPK